MLTIKSTMNNVIRKEGLAVSFLTKRRCISKMITSGGYRVILVMVDGRKNNI